MPSRILVAVFLALLAAPQLLGATRFVRGGSGVLGTYAIIERNGVEFRTNELPPKMNQRLWAELNDADRRALIGVYDWRIGRRIDDFGQATSDEMASWINAAQGWTAAAEALKAKHANKEYPELSATFTNPLLIPDYGCEHGELANSPEYKEAARLAKEIQYDYEIGKGLYQALTNAQWDQLGIAVTAISEELIKIIIDNFVTGLVTNGGVKAIESDLVAQVLDPLMDKIRDIVTGRVVPGSTPPTAPELIAMLDAMMADLESAADGQKAKVESKLARLETLANYLRQKCAERTLAKQEAAQDVREAMFARTAKTPIVFNPPLLVPRNPDATLEEQRNDVRLQAIDWLRVNVTNPMEARQTEKDAAVAAVVNQYGDLVANGTWIGYPGGDYFPDASAGFGAPYYEVMDSLSEVEGWIAIDLPAARTALEENGGKLKNARRDVDAVLDGNLPEIDLLDARNRAMDIYESYLGYKPSVINSFTELRNFNAVIDIAATPDLTVEDLATEYTNREALATELLNSLPVGVNKRRSWMAAQAARYENLRFNWENSISAVIAFNRQIDRLHEHPYFARAEFPSVCYSGVCVYRYAVDVAAINAAIEANGTRVARQNARVAAERELIRLANEENRLIDLLEKSQRSHMADGAELDNFIAGLYARYTPGGAPLAEFAAAGYSLQTRDQLYAAFVPDITYYYLGGWVRNRSLLQTDARSALGLVTGKIYEYYELLDLYNSMKVEKSKYLAMSETEFNAWMTETTKKLEYNGTYHNAFDSAGVYGVEWPCWQLIMKTQRRQDELNAEYRGYPPPAPIAWDIEGTVTTASGSASVSGPVVSQAITGIGVPEVDVVLDGYLTAATKTDSMGRFEFTWIGTGGFDVTASGGDYQFDQPTNIVTITSTDTSTAFNARETASSGFFVLGRITDAGGLPLQGITIHLLSQGVERQQSTAADGTFTFDGIPAGNLLLRPSDASFAFTPPTRTVTLAASTGGLNFTGAPGEVDPGLVVTLSGSGTGAVTGGGINCPTVCFANHPTDTTVTLTATPASGSRFTGWFGRCSGLGTCSVTIDEMMLVAARFDLNDAPDTMPPAITTFWLPATSSSLLVSLNFVAKDDVGVTGYLATTDPAVPLANDPRWTSAAPVTFTFPRLGRWTLYGWAKDAAGNVGAAMPATVTIPFAAPPPAGVAATATSGSRIALSWSAVTGASTYAIERRVAGGVWQPVGNTSATSFVDLGVSPATAYLYRVTAGANGLYSTPSAPDLATTVVFTDSPLLVRTPVRATHLAQLRAAIVAARQLAGLSPYPFTDNAAARVRIMAVHVTEMRTALEQACSTLGMPGYSYVDTTLSGKYIKTVHFQQLRDRLQ